MKRIFSLLVSCILLLCLTTPALADDRPPAPTVGNPATNNEAYAEVRSGITPFAATLSITLARSSLIEQTTGYLKLYAYTAANLFCDEIYHHMELQRWDGSEWYTYYTTYAYGNDIGEHANSAYKNVARKSYYRLRTVHNAFLGSQNASRTLYTDYIYVD